MLTIVAFAWIGLMAFQVRPGRIQSVPRFSRNRRKNPLLSKSLIPTFDFTTPNINVTVDTPFVLNGIPQVLTNTGKLPISAAWISTFVFQLVYDTPGSVTSVTVQEFDPAVRSSTGGYLTPGTFLAS